MINYNQLELLRTSMNALQNKYYFNYGGQGPLPAQSLEAMTESWKKIQELGPFTNNVWPYVANELEETRKLLARICGVGMHRIALTENVTTGCVLPLWGLPFSQGDHILISDCEHPGVVSACQELAKRKGLEIDILHVERLLMGGDTSGNLSSPLMHKLDMSLHDRTRLVVISHLLWNTGQLICIKDIAKRLKVQSSKPFLLVDAAQSFGQIPIEDIAPYIDIYAFTGHKWSLGPEGLGGVCLSERVLNESNPTMIGWRSLKNEGTSRLDIKNPFHSDSRRFEIATSCTPLLAGLKSSLSLLENVGHVGERLNKIKALSKKLWQELAEVEDLKLLLKSPPPSGLVSFTISKNFSTAKIVKKLGEKNIWIRSLNEPNCLRACLHVTSTEEEIAKLVNEIKKIIAQ